MHPKFGTKGCTALPRGENVRLDQTLDMWAGWMRAANLNSRVIQERQMLIRRLAMRQNCDPITCSWEPLAAFISNERYTPKTRHCWYSHLRVFYRWLLTMDIRTDDPTAKLGRIKTHKAVPRPITTDELQAILDAGRFYARTRTMILLAAYQGLRAHEIAKIRGEDIRGDTLYVFGKGSKPALLPLHPVIAAEAAKYPERGFWFPSPSNPGMPITRSSAGRAVSQAMRKAGVQATCHQLRHWYGTQALRSAKGNLRVAQELLRHSSPATTALYTQVDGTQLSEALNALPGVTARTTTGSPRMAGDEHWRRRVSA
ncbi:tyrosine-type recombinase/integrase [Jatrophihabitans sp. DSM 45814]